MSIGFVNSLLLGATLVPAAAWCQSSLPSSAPTQGAQPVTQPGGQSTPRRHSQVLFAAGKLTIHAENASLNGLLREISSATGMAVTGGVAEERVFGNYGPADTGTVLEDLLAGTGSNMLLEESSRDRPLTLVLTPRQGGPTPPSPASFQPEPDEFERDRADLPPQLTRPTPATGTVSPPPPAYPYPGAGASTPADGSTAPSSDTTQQSPNGVKTPQQIYDQLMKLKQQSTPPQP